MVRQSGAARWPRVNWVWRFKVPAGPVLFERLPGGVDRVAGRANGERILPTRRGVRFRQFESAELSEERHVTCHGDAPRGVSLPRWAGANHLKRRLLPAPKRSISRGFLKMALAGCRGFAEVPPAQWNKNILKFRERENV